ncbi:MAG: ATP-binding protein [Bacteroidetes bacterium HGW-Bacteroidetes-15]|nr:MAG: ATP-binding protein [Bacteroidetes bacterium HGW-Bacteroidetes-15]
MKELSLHILDIVQNSIVANATLIDIRIVEDAEDDILSISIVDNGKGMEPEMLQRVTDPYTTSRTTRKVGMGIPLLNDACRIAGGCLAIESTRSKGTEVKAIMGLSHIDRQPLGDIVGVLIILISANPDIDFTYTHTRNRNRYFFSTIEVKEVLEGLPINSPEVTKMIREMISSNLEEL